MISSPKMEAEGDQGEKAGASWVREVINMNVEMIKEQAEMSERKKIRQAWRNWRRPKRKEEAP